jgi:hypothetical protein
MDSITVTVDCIIEEIRTPTTPATLVYNLMSSASVLDLTPNFLQYPPCDYVLNESITWTIPPITASPTAI